MNISEMTHDIRIACYTLDKVKDAMRRLDKYKDHVNPLHQKVVDNIKYFLSNLYNISAKDYKNKPFTQGFTDECNTYIDKLQIITKEARERYNKDNIIKAMNE